MDIKKLNIKPLEDHISGLVGVQILFQKEFKTNRHGETSLHLSSQELIGFSGVFQPAMKTVRIITFNPIMNVILADAYPYIYDIYGASVTVNGIEGKKMSIEGFWGSIYLHYERKNGGTNSVELCDCIFNIASGKWSFK